MQQRKEVWHECRYPSSFQTSALVKGQRRKVRSLEKAGQGEEYQNRKKREEEEKEGWRQA